MKKVKEFENKTMLILIAGGAGTGKSTTATKILEHIQKREENKEVATILHTDHLTNVKLKNCPPPYLKDGVIDFVEVGKYYGNISSYDEGLMLDKIKKIAEEEQKKVIILEGIVSLSFNKINEFAGLKIFINIDDDIKLIRRIQRSNYYKKETVGETVDETKELLDFGSSLKESFELWMWRKKVRSMDYEYNKDVMSKKNCADLILNNNYPEDIEKNFVKITTLINLYFENKELFKNQLEKEKNIKENFWEKKCAFCIISEDWETNDKNNKGGRFVQKDGFGAFVIAENKNHLVMADKLPRTKAHLMIVPKKHQPTIEGMKSSDWNSLLPLLKEMIKRINKVYHPVGFMLYSYNGKESFSFQSVPRFHLHILPVYRKDYGHNWFATRVKRSEQDKNEVLKPTLEEYQEVIEKLQIDVLMRKSMAIVNLVNQEQSLVQGHCVITNKEYISSDIEKVDQETWNQMGELLQIYIKKAREKIEARNFIIHIPLGKMSGPLQEDIDEFQLHITPFKSEKLEYHVPGTSLKESARIAKRIMNPDNPEYSCKQYPKKANKRIAGGKTKTEWNPN